MIILKRTIIGKLVCRCLKDVLIEVLYFDEVNCEIEFVWKKVYTVSCIAVVNKSRFVVAVA